jgi:hypothetical protein
LQHGEPIFSRKERCLAWIDTDRNHELVGKADRVAHHVEMAIGDRIK